MQLKQDFIVEDINNQTEQNIVEDTKKRLKANSNYDMCIDNLLFNMKSIIAN